MSEQVRKLAMSRDEIVVSYRQAANQREQIRILSQLNACPRQDIESILIAAGEPIQPTVNRAWKPWTDEETQELQTLLELGVSQGEIARRMGRSEVTIREHRKKLQEQPPVEEEPLEEEPLEEEPLEEEPVEEPEPESVRPLNNGWTAEEVLQLQQLADDGQDDQTISKALGRTASAVRHKRAALRGYTPPDRRPQERSAKGGRTLNAEEYLQLLLAAINATIEAQEDDQPVLLQDVMAAVGTLIMARVAGVNVTKGDENGEIG